MLAGFRVLNLGINLPGALVLTEAQLERVCDGVRTILGQS